MLTVNSGGTASTPGQIFVAANAGSQGTTTINSGGAASSTSGTYVGGSNSGAGGTGRLNVYGGTLAVGGTLVAYNTPSTKINLTGGSITAAGLNFNGHPELLNWTGGMLNINSSVNFDPTAAGTSTAAAFGSSLTLGANQTLKVTGNEGIGSNGAFNLTVNSGGMDIATGNVTVFAGNLSVNSGGGVQAAGVNINPGGLLNGAGTITSVVQNFGVVAPGMSAGVLHITGAFQQYPSATLNIEIGGTTLGSQYDQLAVTGNLVTAGNLSVSLINGFQPLAGNSFNILNGGTILNTFSTLRCRPWTDESFGIVRIFTTVELSVANFRFRPPTTPVISIAIV